ncbi:hypothetical protein ACWEWI_09775 [Streptomyces sp. NPDC003753]
MSARSAPHLHGTSDGDPFDDVRLLESVKRLAGALPAWAGLVTGRVSATLALRVDPHL